MKKKTQKFHIKKLHRPVLYLCFIFCFQIVSSQIDISIDTDSIKIGEQVTYKIQVESDSLNPVIFPEEQTFKPLEVIEYYKTDTSNLNVKHTLIKKYGLTQFDSGVYTIPKQKIIIGDKTFYTDSLRVAVNNVAIDTTKQGLYNIKPVIEVEKPSSNLWKYILYTILILGLIGFLLYWFIWRKKPLTEEEKIALLPPYERAKLALKKLDESQYLIRSEVKEYYSELTLIIRKYLDEKVYDHSLESTTDQLIEQLKLLKDTKEIELEPSTITNIATILKRADLVKFAKSKPDIQLAEIDKNTIDTEIDHVKDSLPEPTEEEKLLDQQYREEQERKKKRKKIIITVAIVASLIFFTLIGFSIKYGFTFVKDTIIGHESKELLEGNWVTSDYGIPPITITTPKVLKRVELPFPEEFKEKVKITSFLYGTLLGEFSIAVNTNVFPKGVELNLENAIEGSIIMLEEQGASNIFVKTDEFKTSNGAQGLKNHGTLNIPSPVNKEKLLEVNYTALYFSSESVLQQIIMTWPTNDDYAAQMIERILNSVELIKTTE